jgi:histone H3/H4
MSDYSFMKSGLGSGAEPSKPSLSSEDIENIEILLSLFISNAISNASKYVTHCGRNGVSKIDINYALKYEVFEFLNNKNINDDIQKATEDYHAYLEELDEEESHDSEDDATSSADATFIIPDDEVDEFARIDSSLICDSNREFIEKFHKHYDKWDSWIPESPLDKILKNAINKIEV